MDRAWDEALVAAANLLEDHEGHPLLFHEEREDFRLEVGPGGVIEAARTFSSGLSVRGGPAGDREISLADPRPEDSVRLARLIRTGGFPVPGRRPRRVEIVPRLNGEGARIRLEALIAATLRAAGTPRASAAARWVAFEQRIRVARPGRPVVSDIRRGARVLVDARIGGRGGGGSAVVERALPPGPLGGVEELGVEVAARAAVRIGARRAPAGPLAAIFAPGVGGMLIHEIVGHALEADTVRRGASALAAAQGRVAPDGVEIVDDPGRGRSPARYDDEGEEAGLTTIVRRGRVAGLIHDLRSARALGAAPTGHGRRSSFRETVLPRMSCTFLEAGALDPSEVLSGVPKGVYIRRMEAASTDPSSGEAVFRVRDADLVCDGQLDVPLAPFLLLVNTLHALASLERVATDFAFDTCIGSCTRDGQPLVTSVGAPTFRIGLTTVIR
jgi:TldD protein